MASDPIFGTGIIARLAFITMIIIAFYIVLRIGLIILGLIFKENTSPHLFDGMVDSDKYKKIPQNPSKKKSKAVYRSDNEDKGTEFSWSVWLFIDKAQTETSVPYHIFNKGSKTSSSQGGLYCDTNTPGLYLNVEGDTDLSQKKHSFEVLIDTHDGQAVGNKGSANNNIVIEDIPIGKWVHLLIRAEHKTIDVFINGTLVRRTIFSQVIKQNYQDVHIGTELMNDTTKTNGIEGGKISNLWYYDKAIGTREILKLVNNGPNLKTLDDTTLSIIPSYLSSGWYTSSILQ